jgi:hypothetical protein
MSKKILAVALAAAMILGLASVAFAASFSDTEGHARETAIKQLAGLGLLAGYPDGTFRPENPITRAEFAKVMVYALGLKDAAEMLAGVPVPFTDVEANHWAVGFISIATSQEIVKGYPDGTFGPQNNVTYAEVITMLLRALGYGPVLDHLSWPTGYLTKAAELRLNKGISFLSNAPATRGDVAALVANAVSKPKLIPIAWGPDGKPTQYGVSKGDDLVTLLHDMGAEAVEGWLIDSPELFSNDGDSVKVTLTAKWGDKAENTDVTLPVAEGTDCAGFIGHKVALWLNNDGEVFFIEDRTDKVASATFEDSDSIKVSGKQYDLSGDIMFRNYRDLAAINLRSGDQITAIFDGDKVKYVIANNYMWGIVDTVNTTYDRITFSDSGNGASSTLRLADYEITWVGPASDLADLEEYDVVEFITAPSGTKKAVLVVTRNAVVGEFTKLTDDKATVDGTAYSWLTGADGIATGKLGKEVTILLNKDGKIAAMFEEDAAAAPTTYYGVVVAVGKVEDAFDTTWKVKLFSVADEDEVILDFASKVYFEGGSTSVEPDSDLDSATAGDQTVEDVYAAGDVVSYRLNSSGKISHFSTVREFDDLKTDTVAIDEDLETAGGYKVTANTIVINVLVDSVGDFDDVELLSVPALLAIDQTTDGYADGSVGRAKVVILVNAPTGESDTMYGMVYGRYQAKVGSAAKWFVRVLFGDGNVVDYPTDLSATSTPAIGDLKASKTVISFKEAADGSKITKVTIENADIVKDVATGVYKATVADVDLENDLIILEFRDDNGDDNGAKWYVFVTSDTLFYDVTGSAAEAITLGEVAKDAVVEIYTKSDVNASGAIAEVVVVVD